VLWRNRANLRRTDPKGGYAAGHAFEVLIRQFRIAASGIFELLQGSAD
jgi:hypothetical protein